MVQDFRGARVRKQKDFVKKGFVADKDKDRVNYKNIALKKAQAKSKMLFYLKRFFLGVGYCLLNVTLGNIFVTLTDYKGRVLVSKSSGSLKGVKGRKEKCGIYAAEYLGKLLCVTAAAANLTKLCIKIESAFANKNLQVLLHTLAVNSKKAKILIIENCYPYAHNGCRSKKAPRK